MQVSAQLRAPAVQLYMKRPRDSLNWRLLGSSSCVDAREMINISGLCRRSNQGTYVAQPIALSLCYSGLQIAQEKNYVKVAKKLLGGYRYLRMRVTKNITVTNKLRSHYIQGILSNIHFTVFCLSSSSIKSQD